MKFGFAKIGQRLQLDPYRADFAGSAAPANLLRRLARRNPEHTWWIVGRSAGWSSADWPSNVQNVWPGHLASKQPYHNRYTDGVRTLEVVNPDVLEYEERVIQFIESLDGMVLISGTNTTGSEPIPKTGKRWEDGDFIKPTEAMLNTSAPIIRGLNRLGDRTDGRAPVVWLVEDPRCTIQMRDLKWPSGLGCLVDRAASASPTR